MARTPDSGGAPDQGGGDAAKQGWIAWRWVVVAQVALAALLFMAITQLSQVIVTRSLALFGMRTDVPTLLAVEACGQRFSTTPAALDGRDGPPRVILCPRAATDRGGVKLVAAVPSGEEVTLLVNGEAVQKLASATARVTFANVRLHSGDNNVAIAAGVRSVGRWQFEPVMLSYLPTQFGKLRQFPIGAPIALSVPSPKKTTKIVGGGSEAGRSFLLLSGQPESSADIEGIADRAWIGASGFAVVEVGAVPKEVATLRSDQFRRSARITRLPTGKLLIDVEACLPHDSTLAQWARQGTLSPNEFIGRITDVRIDAVAHDEPLRAARIATSDTVGCRLIRGQTALPAGIISRAGGGMLSTPFDTLRIDGFGDRLHFSRFPTSTPLPEALAFIGHWTDDDDTLDIDPDFALLLAEWNAPPKSLATGKIKKPAASRLASAWTRTEAGLPLWLQALLSGIAAVAPLLVLLIAIDRSSATEEAVVQTRTEVKAGLAVLLLLALGAAAQPLLFQLFFRISESLELWEILGEARGEGGGIYPDPYGPVALAIALMLLPFLKALREGRDQKRSLFVALACCAISIAALLFLFIVALIQHQPLPNDSGTFSAWLLFWLPVPQDIDKLLPLTGAALAVALASAWAPIYWAFRSMAPRRAYLGASMLAGAASILLPLASYAVEASRLLFSPEPVRFAVEPSLLALLGSCVLPFTLLITLLLAFKAILVSVAPDALTGRVQKLLRTRNLMFAAGLLLLPRLAFNRVAVAPSDMGIIDILGIFQSFGLVAAVFLAVIQLRAYSSIAPPDDDHVREPLLPFAFQPDELDIITALFAGYLAIWTNGILATAVAVLVGWPLFRRLIIEPDLALPDNLATPELAAALVRHRRDLVLFESRAKDAEMRYAKADSDFAALTAERAAIAKERGSLDNSLGMTPEEAKRRLLEFGPENTPFANGVRGALAGLVFAVVLQLATSIYGADPSGPLTSWADLAQRALADPVYSIAPTGTLLLDPASPDVRRLMTPDLLLFVGAVINACFAWALLGFIFGFAFHRIRGDDGVIKGLVCATGIAIAYAFSQLFASETDALHMSRVIPVFLFLLALGIIVFDAASLRRRKLSPTQIGEVYGFRTSLGYASLIGGLAAFEPLVRAVSGLFSKG